jgi:hypothetical protein
MSFGATAASNSGVRLYGNPSTVVLYDSNGNPLALRGDAQGRLQAVQVAHTVGGTPVIVRSDSDGRVEVMLYADDSKGDPILLRADDDGRLHTVTENHAVELDSGTASAGLGTSKIIRPSRLDLIRYQLVALLVTGVRISGGAGPKVTAQFEGYSPNGNALGVSASQELAPGDTGELLVGPGVMPGVDLGNKVTIATGRLFRADVVFTVSGAPASWEVDFEVYGVL